MKQILTTALLLLVLGGVSYGQEEPITKYTEIDLKVKDNYIRSNDPYDIAEEVTAEFDDDESKVRAIFVWIAHNIEYSFDTYDDQKANRSKRKKQVKSKDPDEKAELIQELKDDDLRRCLKRRGGVVADFSYLFTTMCEAIEIEAGEIKGYKRKSYRRIGQAPRRPIHSWNWAKINGKKYLFDTMMGAGTIGKNPETRVVEFTRKLNDIYFMAPPHVLIMSHYPVKEEYQMLDKKMTLEEYASQPFMLDGFRESKILEVEPKVGILSPKDKVIEFKFKFADGEIPHRILLYDRRKLYDKNEYERQGDYIVMKYTVPENPPSTLKIVVKSSKLYEYEALIYRFGDE